MPLPAFTEQGELPEGIHLATLAEVLERFGEGGEQRREVGARLREIVRLAAATGGCDRVILFGSFVSDKAEPNDVDVLLIMGDAFSVADCPQESLALFDHMRAHDELGASIFWMRPAMLLGEPVDQFVAHWQTKRDGSRRGLVEVRP